MAEVIDDQPPRIEPRQDRALRSSHTLTRGRHRFHRVPRRHQHAERRRHRVEIRRGIVGTGHEHQLLRPGRRGRRVVGNDLVGHRRRLRGRPRGQPSDRRLGHVVTVEIDVPVVRRGLEQCGRHEGGGHEIAGASTHVVARVDGGIAKQHDGGRCDAGGRGTSQEPLDGRRRFLAKAELVVDIFDVHRLDTVALCTAMIDQGRDGGQQVGRTHDDPGQVARRGQPRRRVRFHPCRRRHRRVAQGEQATLA